MSEWRSLRGSHNLKNKHGLGFKRHTKLDDSKLCLYMDAFIPKLGEWIRIDVDQAKEDSDKRRSRAKKAVNAKNVLSTLTDDEEDPRQKK